MGKCVFCNIVKGAEPASAVYSDERVLAFLDAQPVNSGHVLIIPKVHAEELTELDEETGGSMFKVAVRIASALRHSGLRCEGINLHLADGEAASQDVFHVHLHVIPRFRGDGFGFKFGPNYGYRPNRKELNTTAQRIRKAMK